MRAMEDASKNGNRSGGGGFVDTRGAERSVWLMKCPALAARHFQQQTSVDNASSRPVAKVIVSIDPLSSNDSAQFTMEFASTETGNVPKLYCLDISKDFVPMSVFSESSQGKLSVEGKILNKFDMRPHNNNLESYGKLCRERTTKSMTKSRQVQFIDNDKGVNMRPMPGLHASGFTVEKKKQPTKGTETKRTRRDRGEMEEIMFKLFERQPNWTLRQLIHETDQPEQFLKDILKELCVYNNKGSNQGSYELKPEYKKSHDQSAD